MWGHGGVGERGPVCLELPGELVLLGSMTGDAEERGQVLGAWGRLGGISSDSCDVWVISKHRGKSLVLTP